MQRLTILYELEQRMPVVNDVHVEYNDNCGIQQYRGQSSML